MSNSQIEFERTQAAQNEYAQVEEGATFDKTMSDDFREESFKENHDAGGEIAHHPILDKFEVEIQTGEPVDLTQERALRWSCNQVGLRVFSDWPRRTRKEVCRESAILKDLGAKGGRFLFVGQVDGNGFDFINDVILRKGGDTAFSLDGNSNFLDDKTLYGDAARLSQEVILWLDGTVDALKNKVEEALRLARVQRNTKVAYRRLELTWDVPVAPTTLTSEIRNRALVMIEMSPGVTLSRIDPSKNILGFKASTAPGHEFVVYAKDSDLIRCESRYSREFFKGRTDLKEVFRFPSRVFDILRIEAWEKYRRVIHAEMPKIERLSFAEAYMIFATHCPRSMWAGVLDALREGQGILQVRSQNQTLYYAVKKLRDAGILVKGWGRAEYLLPPQYQALIAGMGITERTTDLCRVDGTTTK